MAKKDDLKAEAEALGLALDGTETVAQLEEMIAAKATEGEPTLQRRRISRGSTRRILRAHDEFQTALGNFIAEMDRQLYVADGAGGRVDDADFVKQLREMREWAQSEVNSIAQM